LFYAIIRTKVTHSFNICSNDSFVKTEKNPNGSYKTGPYWDGVNYCSLSEQSINFVYKLAIFFQVPRSYPHISFFITETSTIREIPKPEQNPITQITSSPRCVTDLYSTIPAGMTVSASIGLVGNQVAEERFLC
jgi:hypothetical protein